MGMKVCKITCTSTTYILEVDKRKIAFTGFDNAVYFKALYEKLGYNVQLLDEPEPQEP
jgi:hypothetical protein